MAFATLSELEDYVGQSFDASNDLRAIQALDMATQVIKTYTGQAIEQATTTETFTSADRQIRLSERPVTAIGSVTVGGVVQAPISYAFTVDGWLYEPDAMVTGWPYLWRGGIVVVQYTHGYVTVPQDIKFVCLGLAARVMDNPTALPRESIGSYTTDYHPHDLTPMEKAVLDSYRGVVVA